MSAQWYTEVIFAPGRVGLLWDGVMDIAFCVFFSFSPQRMLFLCFVVEICHT